MESFFELAFPDVMFSSEGDTLIRCPFPHKLPSGETYHETNPSMSINTEKGIYHCFSCGKKGNELQFISELMNISIQQAVALKDTLEKAEGDIIDWEKNEKLLEKNPNIVTSIKEKYYFTNTAIKKLHIGIEGPGRGIAFPVFLFGKIVDVITYNPENKPKYKKRINSKNGIIMPYDEWRESSKPTTIVAGQKDLGIALSKNINAIAITGGEGEIPTLFLNDFKDRVVYIVFDNDDQGIRGANKLATKLKPYTKSLKIIDLSKTCTDKGEDLWDYFVKYKKEKKDLIKLIHQTAEFTEEDYQKEKEKEYPTITLSEAVTNKYTNKIVRSNVQVVATDENKFLMPQAVKATKMVQPEEKTVKNRLDKDDIVNWYFEPKYAKDMLYLIDSNLKEYQILKNIRYLLKYPKEENLKIELQSEETIYKCHVTDYFESKSTENILTEFIAYSVGKKLESGKKYKATYKIVPHPHQGNALTMVIFNIEQSEDSITNFKLTPETIENLKKFQVSDSLEETINSHVDRVKGIVDADFDSNLIKLIDLWFNTPLLFNDRGRRNLRAYLDMLIVAESRVGKSATVEALQATYGLGTIIPFNGSNVTTAGIIGGSHKTKNGFQVRAGLIPQSHKGGVIFEELEKAKGDILQELTQIRSSHTVSVTRVSGSINLPAFVRMLSLTNTAKKGTSPKPISSYPNGVEIILDIVGAPEDIARYDTIAVLPGKGAESIDPYFNPKEPFPKSAYQDRIRWIWSREPEQVVVDEDTYVHAVQHANKLNKIFNSYIKLFGTEAWLKIIRLATAIAAYTVSTDKNFEKIIITKDHVNYAVEFLVNLYDNDHFRFKEFVEEEKKYSSVNEKDIESLQEIWDENSAVVKHLEATSRTSHKNLLAISGLDNSSFNILTNKLGVNMFIRFEGYDIVPTEKFRRASERINRQSKRRVVSI